MMPAIKRGIDFFMVVSVAENLKDPGVCSAILVDFF